MHAALNVSNPKMADDFWLCLALGVSWPLVAPLLNTSDTTILAEDSCTLIKPFKVHHTSFENSICYFNGPKNNSYDVYLYLYKLQANY